MKQNTIRNATAQKIITPKVANIPDVPEAIGALEASNALDASNTLEVAEVPQVKNRVKNLEHPTKKFVNQLMRDRPDIDPKYLYQCLIDHTKYIEKYKDVGASGMQAAEHYFTFGHNEARELKRPGILANTRSFNITSKNILLLSSAEMRDGSFIYRCLFQSAQFENKLVYSGKTEIAKLVRAVFNCKEMIFSRPEKNETAFYLIELAKNIGVKVTLDYDDLLLPEHAEYLGHVRSSDGMSIEEARKSLINKSSFLLYADAFRCSTPEIAKAMSSLGKPIEIVKNKILKSMVADESQCVTRLKDVNARKIKILYLSGTATHKKDYSIIQGAIIKLAQEYPDKFELTFLGNTGGNSLPIMLYNKAVKVIPRVSISEMYKIIAKHDLALAPLESTIFNKAKSNIKFIECGSQGVPIIASPLNEFKDVIVNGKNGWLCDSQIDWYNQLKSIINNPSQLYKTSIASRTCVLKNFTLEG